MSALDKGLDIGKGIVGIIDQAVEDKDLANKLKFDLLKMVASGMLTGKGSSITKITICGLVAFIVVSVMIKWLFGSDLGSAAQLVTVVTPLIGMLIGAYGTSTTIQKISATKNGSQSTTISSRKMRPPYTSMVDKGPSDTKRDHPGR